MTLTPRELMLLRLFAGFLTADLPQLHAVAVPRLEHSIRRFARQLRDEPDEPCTCGSDDPSSARHEHLHLAWCPRFGKL